MFKKIVHEWRMRTSNHKGRRLSHDNVSDISIFLDQVNTDFENQLKNGLKFSSISKRKKDIGRNKIDRKYLRTDLYQHRKIWKRDRHIGFVTIHFNSSKNVYEMTLVILEPSYFKDLENFEFSSSEWIRTDDKHMHHSHLHDKNHVICFVKKNY